MSDSDAREYELPASLAAGSWRTLLAEPERLRPVRETTPHLVVLDTFDRALLAAGLWLGLERRRAGSRLVCPDERGVWQRAPVRAAEHLLAADLAPLPGADRLVRRIGLRALLPQLALTGTRAEWRLADAGTGAARVLLFEERWRAYCGTAEAVLPLRLRIVPLKGARREARALLQRLQQAAILTPAPGLYLDAVSQLGAGWPATVPPMRVLDDPAQRSDQAVRQALRGLLEVMLANSEGVLAETDTEFLHDFRVAVRRTRAVLGQLGCRALPAHQVERFRRGFAALAQATGESRDLDVMRLALEPFDATLPAELRGQTGPLREAVAAQACKAHQRLAVRLRSAAHRRFLAAWGRFLDRPPPRRPVAAAARQPIEPLASRRIWKLYRRLLREGRAIAPDSPAEALHELRKTAKKLRYQMEVFAGLYPAERLAVSLKWLKKLQNLLGAFQDASVQVERLRELADRFRERGAPTATLLAIGGTITRLLDERQRLRARYAAVFEDFASAGHRRRFRQLFRPRDPAGIPEAVPHPAGDGSSRG